MLDMSSMILFLFSVFLMLWVVIVTKRYRFFLLSNTSIFLGLWSLLLFLYSLNLSVFDSLTPLVLAFFVAFFMLYSLTIFLVPAVLLYGKRLPKNFISCGKYFYGEVLIPLWAMRLTFILWVIFFYSFLSAMDSKIGLYVYILSGKGRTLIGEMGDINTSYYIFAYLYLVLTCLSPCQSSLLKRLFRRSAQILVLASLILTSAKVNFVSAVFLIYIIWFNRSGFRPKSMAIQFIALIVGFYLFIFLFSILTGKVIDRNIGSTTGISDVLNFGMGAFLYPYDYAVGSIGALNHVFFNEVQSGYVWGAHVFRKFYEVLPIIGWSDYNLKLPPTFDAFVCLDGVDTNVYTFLYDLIRDFGIVPTLCFAVFLGCFHAYLDVQERTSSFFAIHLLSNVSKLDAFLSFAGLRYTGTFFLATVIICGVLLMTDKIRSFSHRSNKGANKLSPNLRYSDVSQ